MITPQPPAEPNPPPLSKSLPLCSLSRSPGSTTSLAAAMQRRRVFAVLICYSCRHTRGEAGAGLPVLVLRPQRPTEPSEPLSATSEPAAAQADVLASTFECRSSCTEALLASRARSTATTFPAFFLRGLRSPGVALSLALLAAGLKSACLPPGTALSSSVNVWERG